MEINGDTMGLIWYQELKRVGNTPGYNLTVLPPSAFYPVNWLKIGRLFKKPENESESRWVEDKINELYEGETYVVHLWNKRSRELDIEEGSVMARIISDHCVVCDSITKTKRISSMQKSKSIIVLHFTITAKVHYYQLRI